MSRPPLSVVRENIDGAHLLDETAAFLKRFVAFPTEGDLAAVTLWAAHTHVLPAFESTPRIAFLSAEPGSGKTRSLEILETLVPRPVMAVNVSPAYLFRKVGDEQGAPTVLFDEIDTVFGPKAKGDNEDVRGLLNAGHRRGAVAGRCVIKGGKVETEELPAFAAVAMAGLGWLPDTLLTRSVVVRMRRRAASEWIEPYRARLHEAEGNELRDQLAQWTNSVYWVLANEFPPLPDEVQDRNADVWEPLVALADAAGGRWPELARVTAVTAVTHSGQEESVSLGIRLLGDVRGIFLDTKAQRLTTAELLSHLHMVDEGPWSDMRGKPLDARGLAHRLKAYDISSKTQRVDGVLNKGYDRADLEDPWSRYLRPLASSPESVTAVTAVTHPCGICGQQLSEADLIVGAGIHTVCESA